MSLESEIANLVTKATDLIAYFTGKKAAIDQAVSAAIAAVPALDRTWFVNQLTGDDSGPGTAAAPLKSIDKAISNTPAGGYCNVRLMSDYVHATNPVATRVLNISSDVSGTKRKLNLAYQLSAEGAYSLSGFGMTSGGGLGFLDITLVLPTPVGLNPAPVGTANVLIKTYSSSIVSAYALKLVACDVQAPAEFSGALVTANNNAVSLEVMTTTFPSSFGGRYVQGVASGTASNTLSNVLTNLASL
ncbi:hypothetical protein N0U25_07495 [Pseudomonas sivasensis]|uniref:hypothetical protein n=1 Tax=Pseudomonas sivasensis TaxID=1880678 RepID=UPI0021AAF24A|nr:hypothetical protein [Pseudomonas sivasensis]MCT4497632.1 hypothetical protein [Pseudomonas sivasensis]